jgi:hypothetical protein
MDAFCCEPIDDNETFSVGSITCQDDNILECDYDTQCTKLYKLIENKQWEEVLYFMEKGKFYDTTIFTSLFGKEPDPPIVQASTWVTALDETGDVRWCQLPLHAAVTFRAPHSVIDKLVETYPKSVRCADDQDMLPLHYAFRFGCEDDVTALLTEKFPQAISKRAAKDRLPLDMAQYSPRPERGVIIDYFVENAVRTAKVVWDNEHKKLVAGMKNEADSSLKNELVSSRKKLREVEKMLTEAREEMDAINGGRQGRPNQKEGRDDSVTSSRRSTTSPKTNPSNSKYGSFTENEKIPRARNPDHPHIITTEDKTMGSGLRGLFYKRRKQQKR